MENFVELIVDNTPGVLDRVTGIIRRYGWNINSLNAGELRDGITQINLEIVGKNVDINVLAKKLSDMDFVHSWQQGKAADHYFREMIVFKLRESATAPDFVKDARLFKTEDGWRYYEFADTPESIARAAAELDARGVDFARSGAMAIAKKEGATK